MANNMKGPSLIATVIWTILFFPVGLYFIYRRCTFNKLDPAGNSKKLRTFSNVLIALGVMYLLMGAWGIYAIDGLQPSPWVTAVVFFGGLGVLLLFKAIKLDKIGRRYIQYRNIIGSGQDANINSIARMVYEKPDVVEAEIQELISDGCFPEVYIDFETKEIMYKTSEPIIQQDITVNDMMQSAPKEMQPKARTIKCPSCGGINRVIDGEACECEFCSTPLS